MLKIYFIFVFLVVETVPGTLHSKVFGGDNGIALTSRNEQDLGKGSTLAVLLLKIGALEQKMEEILTRLDKQKGLCPDSWTSYGNSCYYISNVKLKWSDALVCKFTFTCFVRNTKLYAADMDV